MELRLLKTFKVVAKQRSFTSAAEQLFLAQSSVSAQIKALEEDLGVRLFDRIGRGIVLTDAGERLLHYASRLEDLSEEMRADVSGTKTLCGSITIRTPETFAVRYMPQVTAQYHVENPDVQINFINCSDARLREELNSGSIDLAFLLNDDIASDNVSVSVLGSQPLSMVVGASHPLASTPNVDSAVLHGESILYMRVD